MDQDLVRGHLHNHWTAATAGKAVFERVAATHPDPETARAVSDLAVEIAEDREALRQMMAALDITPSRIATAAARVAAEAGRLKPNGRVLRRSALTDVLELEALRTAVAGKRAGWDFLRRAAELDGRLDTALLDDLAQRAERQQDRLAQLHGRVADRRLAGS